jgi:dihydroxy-acid dehydratase
VRSDTIKKGFERAPHRSLLRATGLTDEDFEKPFVAIANSHITSSRPLLPPRTTADREDGSQGGQCAFGFNVGVGDRIAMSHGGMLYGLPSRSSSRLDRDDDERTASTRSSAFRTATRSCPAC